MVAQLAPVFFAPDTHWGRNAKVDHRRVDLTLLQESPHSPGHRRKNHVIEAAPKFTTHRPHIFEVHFEPIKTPMRAQVPVQWCVGRRVQGRPHQLSERRHTCSNLFHQYPCASSTKFRRS